MYSAAKDREASLVEMIGKDPKEEMFLICFHPDNVVSFRQSQLERKGRRRKTEKN